MPDSITPINTQTQDDVKIPREDILKLVDLSADAAQKFALEESQNLVRLRISIQNGEKLYDQIKSGQEVTIVAIGSGQFPIPASESPKALVENILRQVAEIKPQPPNDEIKELLRGIAQKALTDSPKELEVAVACHNYIADGNLAADPETIAILTGAAQTDHEKYELAKALEAVMSQAAPQTPQTPSPTAESQISIQTQAEQPVAPQVQASGLSGQNIQTQTPQATELKKPYLPFAAFRSPTRASTNTQNGQNPPGDSSATNGQLDNDSIFRPVPPNPNLKIAQEIS